jgi:hypothetical protein
MRPALDSLFIVKEKKEKDFFGVGVGEPFF